MGQVRVSEPVLLIVAVFSRHQEAIDWAAERLTGAFGPIAFTSLPFHFNQTTYYEDEMGPGLRKLFLVFHDLVAPDCLPRVKLLTNGLEMELAASSNFPETRPLNLDPGLLSLGKFLLASTKDQAHRVYLSEGIFAEVTLRFQAKAYEPWPWTYADYRQSSVIAFLGEAREYYRSRRRETAASG